MELNFILNILNLVLSFLIIGAFALKGVSHFNRALQKILQENMFYTEIILGMESTGKNLSSPNLFKREVRIAIWELYNNLRVQPNKDHKIITLHRKMLDKRQELYHDLEQGKVTLEILPFLGILGTLLGFAVPYLMQQNQANQLSLNLTGMGFFLAATSTIAALLALIYLKKNYEAKVLAEFDYFESQEKALEKIMLEYDGFRILEEWLKKWPLEKELPKAYFTQEKFID